MADFPRLDKLAVATNSRGLFDGMLVYFDQENAKDLDFTNGLHNLWPELLECTNERKLFITEMEGLRPSVKRLVPSCFAIFDLEPSSLSFDFFEYEHVVMNLNSSRMRCLHLHLYMNPEIKQSAIKLVDEYGFVILLDLVGLTSGSMRTNL
ncbi:hypothetical protein Tco_0452174 [Tanacetum coccineum]